jgi:hypothetical protein
MTPTRQATGKRIMATKKATKHATPRPRLTVDITPSLKRRIKVAAAAQDVPVSAYIARVLEQAVPAADTVTTASDGTISQEMIRRAAALRAEQKAPFPEDSADLIRESREQRNAQL